MSELDSELEQEKSKSAVKRELEAIRQLGRTLVALPAAMLDRVTLDERLREAIIDARGFKRGALRRQIQRIGVLLREEDEGAIRHRLERLSQPHWEEVQALHEVEQWRDRLLDGDDLLLTELLERFTTADRQHFRQLLRSAKKEQLQNSPPKSARLLFRYLTELREAE